MSERATTITPDNLETAGFRNSSRCGYLKAAGMHTVSVTQGCSNWWLRVAWMSGFSMPKPVESMEAIGEFLNELERSSQ